MRSPPGIAQVKWRVPEPGCAASGELDRHFRILAHPFEGVCEGCVVRDREGQMMKADVGATVERRDIGRIRHTPQREPRAADCNRDCRIVAPTADYLPAEQLSEDVLGRCEVGHCEASVIHAANQLVRHIYRSIQMHHFGAQGGVFCPQSIKLGVNLGSPRMPLPSMSV